MTVVVKIIPNERGTPPSKLADAELHFTGRELDGPKLIGFSVWKRRGGSGRSVSFPGRQYRIGDERRSFALLRPIGDPLHRSAFGTLFWRRTPTLKPVPSDLPVNVVCSGM